MAKLLQPRESIPPSCEKHTAELSDSVWTELVNNEWIYFITTSESIAILCTDRAPVDVALIRMGQLGINTNDRGYSKSPLLQKHSVVTVNSSLQGKHLTSRVNFEYECSEEFGVKFNLSSIHLSTISKHIISYLDGLNIARHKIFEIERIIVEQEWKRLHTTSHNSYSVLVHVCFFLIGMYVIYNLCNCLKGKVYCIKAITDTNRSGNIVNIKIIQE
jgi:hypothetical protein